MAIVFFCQSCGARFDVPDRMSGRTGRCNKCGQTMAVPQATELASMAAAPAVAAKAAAKAAAVAAPPRPKAAPAPVASRAEAESDISLKPITEEDIPIVRRVFKAKDPLDDDLGDSKPYAVNAPVAPQVQWRVSGKLAGKL